MSIEATLATWKLGKEVTPIQKLILLALSDRAGENGECWPSLKRIMADTNLERRSIIDNRTTLIEKGYIVYTGEYKGRSGQIPVMRLTYINNREGILSKHEELFTSAFDAPVNENIKCTGASDALVPVHEAHQSPVHMAHPESKIIESKKEPKIFCEEFSLDPTYEYPDTLYPKPEVSRHSKQKRPLSFKLPNFEMENPYQIPMQMIMDWKVTRDKQKRPITKTVWNKILKELEICKSAGINPIEAFEEMVCRGWVTLKLEYLNKQKPSAKKYETKKPALTMQDYDNESWGKNTRNYL